VREAVSLAALLVSGSVARIASADGATDRAQHEAEVLFRIGTEELDAGNIDAACRDLAKSLRLDSKLGTLLNVAFCHEKQSRSATAWLEYTTAAAWAVEVGRLDRRDFAHERAADLERGLSRVELDARDEPDAEIEIDGQSLRGRLSALPLFLDPGEHLMIVRAAGKLSLTQEVVVRASSGADHDEAPQVVVVPRLARNTEPADARGEAVVPPARWPATRWAGVGVAGAGVVALGVGGYFGVHSLTVLGSAGSTCAAPTCTAQQASSRNDARTSETLSLVAVSTGVAALAAGAWLWVAHATTPVTGVRVMPLVAARGGGVRVSVAW
jgi:hypothetical protein